MIFLVLRAGHRLIPLSDRPIAIGRLPECEVALEGTDVSRRHARIIPTPEGPLLIDRSRFGTFLNGSQVIGPALLVVGDRIAIGRYELEVESAEALARFGAPRSGHWTPRLAEWRRRYGTAEVAGTVAAVIAALTVRRATGSIVAAAYAGTVAEAAWFYGVLLLREWKIEGREARKGGFERRPFRELARDLLLEFGPAEVVDGLMLRPLCLGLGLRFFGGWIGVVLGKLAADLLFYGPVLAVFHWRRAGRRSGTPALERRRATTATLPPDLPPE
jgi:hypothetical protein